MANEEYLSPFPEAGILAFQTWWAEKWKNYASRKLTIGIIGNGVDLRKADDIWHTQQLPTMLITPARFEIDGERGGGAVRFRTLATGINEETGTVVLRKMAPVRMGLTCSFRTDNYKEVQAFAELLLNSYPGHTFYFQDDTGFVVEARIYLDNGVDLPPMDVGNEDLFVIEMVISMTTYIGSREEKGLIRSIEVRFLEGTGAPNVTIGVDVNTGAVIPLEDLSLTYTGPFDTTSSQWKGV